MKKQKQQQRIRGIREIQFELDELRKDYEYKKAILENQIALIRKSRGTKLKELSWEGHTDKPGPERNPYGEY